MDMTAYFLGRLAGDGTGDSGGDNGPVYTDLVYNDDGSITLTDDEGQEHIIECEYVDGRLEKVKIDENVLDAVYEEDTDKLIKLGDINIEVGDYPSEIGNIETLIDNSGVLEDTEGTVTEKVEQLIDKANELDVFTNITNAYGLFQGAKSFPIKAVVNLPNATNIGYAFANWVSVTPKVEEVIVNAPNVSNSARVNTEAIFGENKCVNRVVLNLPNETKYLYKSFTHFGGTEVVLGFSTKSVETYDYAFRVCKSLKKIIGVLDFSSATGVTGTFQICDALEEVTFEPNTLSISLSLVNSSKLSAESIQSIIDGLATVTTAQTLTLHSTITLTDEQKATINAKGWTLAQ